VPQKKPQQNISPPGTTVPGGLINEQHVLLGFRQQSYKHRNVRSIPVQCTRTFWNRCPCFIRFL